jgi:hypothetical protein
MGDLGIVFLPNYSSEGNLLLHEGDSTIVTDMPVKPKDYKYFNEFSDFLSEENINWSFKYGIVVYQD